MPKTMEELAKALENHAAQAAIAVSRTEYSLTRSRSPGPATGPYWSTTKRTPTTTPSSSPTPGPAGSACATYHRRNHPRHRTVEAALTKARQALTKHQSARSCFTIATKKIEEGTSHVTALVDEVRTALTELSEELNRS